VDSTIKIWNAVNGTLVREWKQSAGIAYMDVSSDGNFIVTGGYDSKVRLWQASNGALLREFSGHKGTVWDVAFNKEGSKIASSGDDAIIRVWDLATGRLYRELKRHKRIVWAVKFSPDGTHLASGSFDYSWKLWRLLDGKVMWDNREHTETVVDLAFSYDGTSIATTSDDKSIRIWDLQHRGLKRMMKVPEHVQAVAFSPNDKRILTGGRDKTMIGEFLQNFFGNFYANPGVSARLWDVETGELLHCFTSHGNDVLDVAYSSSGRFIATASADRSVQVWQVIK
jgi:WD40 repeat protein